MEVRSLQLKLIVVEIVVIMMASDTLQEPTTDTNVSILNTLLWHASPNIHMRLSTITILSVQVLLFSTWSVIRISKITVVPHYTVKSWQIVLLLGIG